MSSYHEIPVQAVVQAWPVTNLHPYMFSLGLPASAGACCFLFAFCKGLPLAKYYLVKPQLKESLRAELDVCPAHSCGCFVTRPQSMHPASGFGHRCTPGARQAAGCDDGTRCANTHCSRLSAWRRHVRNVEIVVLPIGRNPSPPKQWFSDAKL